MKKLNSFLLLYSFLFAAGACGVRGDPVPPKTPSYLGRGQPTYKGATEDLKFPTVPPVYAPQNKEEEKAKERASEKINEKAN